jgi:hypothetical protein
MAKNVFVVSTCDAWLTHASMTMLCISTTRNKAILVCRKHSSQDGNNPLDKDELAHLKSRLQTQGREENYYIEEVTLNELQF